MSKSTTEKRQTLAPQTAQILAAVWEPANRGGAPAGPRPGSMTSAMHEVLAGKRKGMTAREITAEILERKLAPGLGGKTPHATVGAKLATEAKKPDGLFKRTAPGQFLNR